MIRVRLFGCTAKIIVAAAVKKKHTLKLSSTPGNCIHEVFLAELRRGIGSLASSDTFSFPTQPAALEFLGSSTSKY